MSNRMLAILIATTCAAALAGCVSTPPRTANAVQPTPTTHVPAPPKWLGEVERLYPTDVRVPGLESRRFPPAHWWWLAIPLLTDDRGFVIQEAGHSAEGRPLHRVSWGQGRTRVLLWSQMHGDESTATMALTDLFRFLGEHPQHPIVQRLRAATTLHFLPLMNPDGAIRFQRRSAQGIDINRDARALASPEAQTLKRLYDEVRPDFSFNLHDQQAGYRAGDTDKQTAIALLAPPHSDAREVNPLRRSAIEVAVAIRAALEPSLGGHIARWDDTFNPRAFGDLTAAWGSSTVLIEAGGIDGDPEKQQLRRHYFLGLLAALDAIASGSHRGLDIGQYFALPENGKVWPDLMIRGGTIVSGSAPPLRADVLIDFDDALAERGGTVKDVGDLSHVRARREIDASGLYITSIACPSFDVRKEALQALVPDSPACLRMSRDPAGRDVVWTLLRDVDPARPSPRR